MSAANERDYVTPEQVAHEVSKANNNPDMRGLLMLLLGVVEREGFRFVRTNSAHPVCICGTGPLVSHHPECPAYNAHYPDPT